MEQSKINQQDEIKFINTDLEAVRKLPDVYIGALGDRGFLNMIREIFQNSLDEIIKGNTLDLNIIISYDARSKMVIVEDFGQGIELKVLDKVFSVLHSSSNYDKKEGSGKFSSGKNGMGATITNFLSKFFIVESYRMDGNAARVEFNEGILTKKGIQKIKCPKGRHGLMVSFAPSDMMGEITLTDVDVYNLVWLITHLSKIGTRVVFNAIDLAGNKHQQIIDNTRGIYDILNGICDKNVIVPISFSDNNGTMKADILFTYDIANMDDPKILGFANMCPTDGGTHIDGFLDAIVKYFRDYMNKIYLANNKKLTVNAQDIKTGLRAVISVAHLYPLFTGQSKEIFSKEDMKPYVAKLTTKSLDTWAKANPNDLQKICKYLKEVCEIRSKVDGEKVKMSDKYTASVISGLPDSYKKPNINKDFEVIIVEGLSAGGGISNNRDKDHQGIFPIRGKINNAFTTPTKKYFENAEVAGLFKVFGYNGYSRKFDPKQFKPSKVIIMADADADGAHIESLVFGLFLRYLPFVIEEGKLYAARPPLYGIDLGKGKKKFLSNTIDYVQYVQTEFCNANTVANVSTKKSYTRKEITQIIYKNIDYVKFMNKVADTYAINPKLLEFILMNKDLAFTKFKSLIETTYKSGQVKVTKENDIIVIRGLVESKFQTVFLGKRLLNDCNDILNLLSKSEDYYIVNGVKMSLYELMMVFKSFEPKNITRYKGLGEMDKKDLGESSVIPGMGRTLKQYTIQDAKELLRTITELQSDKSAFVKNIKIRKEDII